MSINISKDVDEGIFVSGQDVIEYLNLIESEVDENFLKLMIQAASETVKEYATGNIYKKQEDTTSTDDDDDLNFRVSAATLILAGYWYTQDEYVEISDLRTNYMPKTVINLLYPLRKQVAI